MKQSKQFTLNQTDWKRWGKNAFIFCAPALIVLLGNVQDSLPQVTHFFKNPANAAIFIFTVERAIDLGRKYLNGVKGK